MENGSANPTDHLVSVAEATGKPLDWFLTEPQGPVLPRRAASISPSAIRTEGGRLLVLGALVLLVVIRFFTEVVGCCRGPPTSSTCRFSWSC